MRIAVTGAGGYLGSAIVRHLLRDDSLVVGAFPSRGEGGVDITDRRALKEAFAEFRPDVVINAAGVAHFNAQEDVSQLFAVNSYGVENVVYAAAAGGARRVVHLSSVMVYGHGNQGVVTENSELSPEGHYATSKKLGEDVAIDAAAKGGIGLVILRLAMVPSGKNQSNLADLINALRRGRFVWVGDGSNHKTLLSEVDAVRGVVHVAKMPTGPETEVEVFNLCNPPIMMREIIDEIASALGRHVPRLRLPRLMAGALAAMCGGYLGVPEAARLRKFLASDFVSGDAIAKRTGFRYSGDVKGEIRASALKSIDGRW